MRVLHLISTSVFSGAENVACQIINMFKNNNDVDMYYVSVIGENKKILKDRNIKYIELKKFNLTNISKVIKEYKPDIIHAHDIKASFLASFFHKKAKIISHVHNNHENMRKFGLKTFLYNFVSNRFSNIIWVSQSALDSYYYKGKVLSKSIVLYNVINQKEIQEKVDIDKNNYNFDLVFLGRLTYQKNPERLIEIAKLIVKDYSNFKMAIVGDGYLKENIEKMISDYNLSKNVFMLGFMNNPYKVLKSSKLLILTSRFEGTPMVALESMALGVPIISTHTDGMVDIIQHGKNGFLCDTNDEFKKHIIDLLSDNKKLNAIQKKALETSEEVNGIEKYKKEISNLYGM